MHGGEGKWRDGSPPSVPGWPVGWVCTHGLYGFSLAEKAHLLQCLIAEVLWFDDVIVTRNML